MRYVLLDRIELLEPPTATGIKCVSLSDDVFTDHFPGFPLFPGALLIEGMAQLGGVLVEETLRRRGRHDLHAVLTMVDRTKFRRQVRPGDRLVYQATAQTVTEDGGQVAVRATIDDTRVAETTLSFALVEVADPRLLQTRADVLATWLTGSI